MSVHLIAMIVMRMQHVQTLMDHTHAHALVAILAMELTVQVGKFTEVFVMCRLCRILELRAE